ncbi:hypothetical protein Salat_0833000 [Sesamum alatum]|uniref:Protein FAR1-RELATED SEQUENCE n=1 Tax=Sesamum alatum TaxID=300844 RepID=A0AAE2CQF3_9LAMI|nr:hypothetical protein Salat_0833000 [Sesamum alatum]
MGILCKHALKVLGHAKVHSIPEQFIKKRWTKDIRNRVSDIESGSQNQSGNDHVSEMVFVNHSMRSFYEITMRCKGHKEARNMLAGVLEDTIEKTNAMFEDMS